MVWKCIVFLHKLENISAVINSITSPMWFYFIFIHQVSLPVYTTAFQENKVDAEHYYNP